MHIEDPTLYQIYATFVPRSGERISQWWDVSWIEEDRYQFYVPTGRRGEHSEEMLIFNFLHVETSPDPARGYEYRLLNRIVEEADGAVCIFHHSTMTDGSLETLLKTKEDNPPTT